MKLAITILTLVLISLHTIGQSSESGIHFEKGLTWEQVQEKAKKEGKYILVDCYATWCKPCKEMDIQVYPDPAVGAIVNNRFISVKVQMDSSKSDNENIKILYPVARKLEKSYSINYLPTYLFFSPDGSILHKGGGVKTVTEFIALVTDAVDTTKQLYTMVKNAQLGKIPHTVLVKMANELKDKKENNLAKKFARCYYDQFLSRLPVKDLLTIENIMFLGVFANVLNSSDQIFDIYGSNANAIDSMVKQKGFAKGRINWIISKEEISPAVDQAIATGKEPDWRRIKSNIRRKYDKQTAKRLVLDGQVYLYRAQKNWKAYNQTLIKKWKTDRDGFEGASWMQMNQIAWTLGVTSSKKAELKFALAWINFGLQKDPKPNSAMLDTKAVILYQLGNKSEAIATAKEVVKVIKQIDYGAQNEEYKTGVIAMFQKRVDKMRRNEPLQLSVEE